jgi:hypothetical protein
MSTRCHFVSFGAGKIGYKFALRRLAKEINQLDSNAQVWLFDEFDIGEEIEGLGRRFSEFASEYPKGHGLWLWKPWVILEVLNKVRDGDIVFYLDAGCTVHTSSGSKARYLSYLGHIREYGSLIFQQKYTECCWTKNEVVQHFELNADEMNSGQILGGIQGHLVNETSRKLVSKWLQACALDSGRLLTDIDSRELEDDRFVSHRQDQSILSCIAKQEKLLLVQDETFFHPNWNRDGDGYPFWATRKCSGIPSWMGYYAPKSWPHVLMSKLKRKSIIDDPNIIVGM